MFTRANQHSTATPEDDSEKLESFADLMGDVQPIQQSDRVTTPRRVADKTTLHYRRAAASREEHSPQDGLSSEILNLVESEEELIYASAGIQLRQMKKLKQGHIPWEAGLDLHGFGIDEARDELSRFIRDAVRNQARCVIVVHGKAYNEEGKPPLLKSYLNDWLQQLPAVSAFCSAQPKDGGRGAVYVLLKRGR